MLTRSQLLMMKLQGQKESQQNDLNCLPVARSVVLLSNGVAMTPQHEDQSPQLSTRRLPATATGVSEFVPSKGSLQNVSSRTYSSVDEVVYDAAVGIKSRMSEARKVLTASGKAAGLEAEGLFS